MRPSNRTKILDAAVRVINRDGMGAVTFEAVSAEAGLTRGGLLYHFPSREALLAGINEHLVARWEGSLEDAAGKAFAATSAAERHAAYARVSAIGATRAELQFMLDSSGDADTLAPWAGALDRWAPALPADAGDTVAMDHFIARLAADGLWIYDAITPGALDPALRARIADRIAALFNAPEVAAVPVKGGSKRRR